MYIYIYVYITEAISESTQISETGLFAKKVTG